MDKDLYKVLSDENFTREHRQKLEGLPSSFDFSGLLERFSGAGSGASSEVDFSPIRTEIEALRNDVAIKLAKKLNVQPGKVLSSNDFTNDFKSKLEGLPSSFSSVTLEQVQQKIEGSLPAFQNTIYNALFNEFSDIIKEPSILVANVGGTSASVPPSFIHISRELPSFEGGGERFYGQNGKIVLIEGSGSVYLNDAKEEGSTNEVSPFYFGFSCTYQKKDNYGSIKFELSQASQRGYHGQNLRVILVDGTDTLNGGAGSTATVTRVGYTIYLRISNAPLVEV